MTLPQYIVDFYTQPAAMTSAGRYRSMFEDVPRDLAALIEVVQGLLLHEHLAAYAYGVELSNERRAESHVRPVERILERLLERNGQRLAPLPVSERFVCTCRTFTLLFVALLRAQGIPARARCGFGAYFRPGYFEDHWVSEYWDAAAARWVRVDAQIDAVQRKILSIDFNLLDVPHDRFVIAGDAWAQCRSGAADPAQFGFSLINENGLWFIAGNLIRDAAALNNMEMLPWDVWGGMPGPDHQFSEDQLAFFDRLAALTRTPDTSFAELRALYEGDERLRVPPTVFNAVLSHAEAV